MNRVRTRFAPSPTGFMHIGNLRSALFTYLIAKHEGGDFILRIEDTDQTRKVDGAVEFIYNTLSLAGINIDEGPINGGEYGPYTQSERLDLYKKYAKKLVDSGHAYYCFCDEERLEKLRKKANDDKVPFMYDGHCKNLSKEEVEENIKNGVPYVIRQAMPHDGVTEYNDVVYGKISIENKVLEDQILIKSDGYPTYNFANVIDDHLMGITHVTRGNEYLSSTPKYLLLYDALGFDRPTFIHLPHIVKADGTKISKRNKDDNFMDLINAGFLPEAIVNYLALIGWSPKDNKEFFTMDELIENFDIKRIHNAPGSYDIKKLEWFNNHYIKEMNDEDYYKFVIPFLENGYDISNLDKEYVKALVKLYKPSLSKGSEIVDEVEMFFRNDLNLSDEAKEFMEQDGIDNTINVFRECLEQINDWNAENINNAIMETKEKALVKGKMLYMPIRIKVSGQMHGPELPDTIYLLGREKVLDRLK